MAHAMSAFDIIIAALFGWGVGVLTWALLVDKIDR
jgi:hypothetical protein